MTNRNIDLPSQRHKLMMDIELPRRQKFRSERTFNLHWSVWAIVIFFVLAVAVFIRWSEWHTKHAEAAYNKYEQCVEDTYGVSATKFYQVYGRPANCK